MDKSINDTETSEKILKLLTNVKPEYKISFMIFTEKENGVTLVTLSNGKIISYPLGWKTAAFIGYCLLQEAIKENTYKDVIDYISDLSKRRDEIAKWILESREWFAEFRNRNK
jgi:hypothetical protein